MHIDISSDHPVEECGLFGLWGHESATALTILGLHALQHRGQEAAGIVAMDKGEFHAHRARGLVGDVFGQKGLVDASQSMAATAAIGHVRYATTGATDWANIQPLFANTAIGGIGLAHNGNLTNAAELRRKLVAGGQLFQSTTDTEAILQLMARSYADQVHDRLIEALKSVQGAYSLLVLSDKGMIGVRDPNGVRPLVLGQMGDTYCLSSETAALDIIGADFVRDIEPGEMVIINDAGIISHRPFLPAPPRFCIFEYIYFSRPDSQVEGLNVTQVREAIGKQLAREFPVEADVVIPVPDSGMPAALGYAEAAGIPFRMGILRSHYRGRTFIEPTDKIRHLGVKLKLSVNRALVEDKRVVVVDDSIVRGTTMPKIVEMVRRAGAREVHIRVASPPFVSPCFYGIDTPARHELMAAQMTDEEMLTFFGCDSLSYLSMDGLYRALGLSGRSERRHCDACFTADYPIAPADPPGPLARRRSPKQPQEASAMRVLLVGSGGREDALALALRLSPSLEKLYVAPGNAGLALVAEPLPLAATDLAGLVRAAQDLAIDLVVVGPEAPLVDGLVDRLEAVGIAAFGPLAAAARLEGSKAFMKDVCAAAGIPTAGHETFTDLDAALAHVRGRPAPMVVKADGLAAGKGVIIAETQAQAEQALRTMLQDGAFGDAGATVLVEDFLDGEEVSYFALADGSGAVVPLSSAQDHKRIGEGDTGPNTGGMGAYSPAPVMTEALERQVLDTILHPLDAEMRRRGCPYRGVLFAGLMVTSDGPKLLEINCRFGDPEAQVILPRLETDLLRLCLATARGELASVADQVVLTPRRALGVVLATRGYPGSYPKGTRIAPLPQGTEDSLIFHAGTGADEAGNLIATGGRVLTVVGFGDSVTQAKRAAYAQVDRVDWPEGYCRRDIGWRALAREQDTAD